MNYPPLEAIQRIEAKPTNLSSVRRNRVAPVYDFAEQATQEGKCFALPRGGYFVVAPEKSLLPRFVVEIRLPERVTNGELVQLSYTLVDNSSGMLWFDSEDDDAHQLCWFLHLPVRVKSPLFAWPENRDRSLAGDAVKSSVKTANPNNEQELTSAISLLTSFPIHRGGQVEEWAHRHVSEGRVKLLSHEKRFIGAAIVSDQADIFSTVTIVLDNDYQSKGYGIKFMDVIGEEIAVAGRRAVVSMSEELPASYRGARGLGMRIIKHGYIAQLGQIA